MEAQEKEAADKAAEDVRKKQERAMKAVERAAEKAEEEAKKKERAEERKRKQKDREEAKKNKLMQKRGKTNGTTPPTSLPQLRSLTHSTYATASSLAAGDRQLPGPSDPTESQQKRKLPDSSFPRSPIPPKRPFDPTSHPTHDQSHHLQVQSMQQLHTPTSQIQYLGSSSLMYHRIIGTVSPVTTFNLDIFSNDEWRL
ncbi:hypothetical protein BT69DRAFT_1330819 [Atractiella rhizophila]|nr:hypothetical protein BT69DRAFT_1330819 [Atractiella rhizophila]